MSFRRGTCNHWRSPGGWFPDERKQRASMRRQAAPPQVRSPAMLMCALETPRGHLIREMAGQENPYTYCRKRSEMSTRMTTFRAMGGRLVHPERVFAWGELSIVALAIRSGTRGSVDAPEVIMALRHPAPRSSGWDAIGIPNETLTTCAVACQGVSTIFPAWTEPRSASTASAA